MKLNLIVLVLIGSLVISCGNKKTEMPKEEPKTAPAGSTQATPTGEAEKAPECYRYLYNKDTINLQISEAYNMITGLLIYRYYQKDKNLGTIQGKMIGDILLADYTFKSEGKVSTRQVAFKKRGEDFVEGFGQVIEVNGKMVFKNIQTLNYFDAVTLKRVPCNQ